MTIKSPIHFIGIGGSGMSPLAAHLHSKGYKVQGSDISVSKITNKLSATGIEIFIGHKDANIENAKTIIISSAISKTNPELLAAQTNNLTILHRSELLSEISKPMKSIFVGGSHGKTTTTAILAHIFKEAGLDPTAIVGGQMLNYHNNHLSGSGEYFIAEADESDGTFLNYRPFVSVITNIDNDHLDHYGTIEKLQKSFLEFARNTDTDGLIVLGWDCKNTREIARDTGEFTSFGRLIGCHNRLMKANLYQHQTEFTVILEREVFKFKINMIGKHNIQNALAAITIANDIGISSDSIKKSLLTFKGISRRLEIILDNNEFTVINDYAHNPGKISSAVEAIKTTYSNSKIIVVFQPHRYSRLKSMYDLFCKSFTQADQVIVCPIFAAGEDTDKSINQNKLSKDISKLSIVTTDQIEDLNSVYKAIRVRNSAHNVILLLGAGDIEMAIDPLLEQLDCLENI